MSIPGLEIVRPAQLLRQPLFTRRGGLVRWYWSASEICRPEQIRGFRPTRVCLWTGSDAPAPHQLPAIRQQAANLSLTLRQWLLRREQNARPPTWGYVYFAKAAGKVKIGFSVDVDRRLSELQTGMPHGLELLHTLPGTKATERALHARFADLRFDREWFWCDARIETFIAEAKANSEKAALGVDRRPRLRVIQGPTAPVIHREVSGDR